MKRYEIENLQRDLKLDKEKLRQSKECLVNAKWYEPLYKINLRCWIGILEDRINRQIETITHQINKYYKL